MFEARGVWQSRTYPNQADRINRGRLHDWHSNAKGRRQTDAIAQLISSDRPFGTDPEGAYAEAWALTFFLIESTPKKYIEYMAKTAARPAFTDYPGPKRLQDFTDVRGDGNGDQTGQGRRRSRGGDEQVLPRLEGFEDGDGSASCR